MHLSGAEILKVSAEHRRGLDDADLDSWVLDHAIFFVEY